MTCLSWRAFIWFCSSATSCSMIDSQSFITASPIPSCTNLDRSFSVETIKSSEDAKSPLDNSLGNWSLATPRASIHVVLSSLDWHRKWSVFVPVNIESLLSSDLLARTDETCMICCCIFLVDQNIWPQSTTSRSKETDTEAYFQNLYRVIY